MIFKILLPLFLFAAAVQALPLPYNTRIFVRGGPYNQGIDEPLCLVLRGFGKAPRWLSVSGYRDVDECARFEFTQKEQSTEYQFQEQSTGKLMINRDDRIYVDGEPGDQTAQTVFSLDSEKDDNGVPHYYLRALNAKPIYAEYPSGEINTKDSGEIMFISYPGEPS